MSNPILMVEHGGYGATPECPQALFKPGDVVKVRRLKFLKHLPEIAAVAIVVPPGFPAEYALADAKGGPRPLMITRTRRYVQYIVAFDGDQTPYLIREKFMKPSDEPSTTVGWTA